MSAPSSILPFVPTVKVTGAGGTGGGGGGGGGGGDVTSNSAYIATEATLGNVSSKLTSVVNALPTARGPVLGTNSLSVVPASTGFDVTSNGANLATQATLATASATLGAIAGVLPNARGPVLGTNSLSVVPASTGFDVTSNGANLATQATLATASTTLTSISSVLPSARGPVLGSSSLSVVPASTGFDVTSNGANLATQATLATASTTLTSISSVLPSARGPVLGSSSLSVVPASTGFDVTSNGANLATQATLATASTTLTSISSVLPSARGPVLGSSSLSVVPASTGFDVTSNGANLATQATLATASTTLTSIAGVLPSARGPVASASSLSVVPSSSGFNVTSNGANVATETTLSALNTKIPAIGPQASASSLSVIPSSSGFNVTSNSANLATQATLATASTTLTSIANVLPSARGPVTNTNSLSVVPSSSGFDVTSNGANLATQATLSFATAVLQSIAAGLPSFRGPLANVDSLSVVPNSNGFNVTSNSANLATQATLATLATESTLSTLTSQRKVSFTPADLAAGAASGIIDRWTVNFDQTAVTASSFVVGSGLDFSSYPRSTTSTGHNVRLTVASPDPQSVVYSIFGWDSSGPKTEELTLTSSSTSATSASTYLWVDRVIVSESTTNNGSLPTQDVAVKMSTDGSTYVTAWTMVVGQESGSTLHAIPFGTSKTLFVERLTVTASEACVMRVYQCPGWGDTLTNGANTPGHKRILFTFNCEANVSYDFPNLWLRVPSGAVWLQCDTDAASIDLRGNVWFSRLV